MEGFKLPLKEIYFLAKIFLNKDHLVSIFTQLQICSLKLFTMCAAYMDIHSSMTHILLHGVVTLWYQTPPPCEEVVVVFDSRVSQL